MHPRPESFDDPLAWVRAQTGATEVHLVDTLQELWSGYGAILRLRLEEPEDGGPATRILKRVDPPRAGQHPRGWNTDRSHARKLRSYSVESCFYQQYATLAAAGARTPQLFAAAADEGSSMLLLEDLDAAGFAGRRMDPDAGQIDACLRWLAEFHAGFVGTEPLGLWPEGTYWHLDTRPDELAAIADPRLQAAAPELDARLRGGVFQTLVHGDAKVANFCFGPKAVAAVDFQYVGGGCGMKDLAYFLSSVLDEEACARDTAGHLDRYFAHFRAAAASLRPALDCDALEREWRDLYPIAWADFFRFLAGWSPGHWKIHSYSAALTAEVLDQLSN